MRRKQARGLGVFGEVGVKAEEENNIGLCVGLFQLQPVEKRNTVCHADEFQLAGALLFETRPSPWGRGPIRR